MATVIFSILAVFGAASILFQFDRCKRFLAKADPLGLLPNYSFFAPRPLMNDYRLVYRTEAGGWREAPLYRGGGLLRTVFNPEKYYSKAFTDAAHFVLEEYQALSEDRKNFIQFSLSYINLLKLLSTCIPQEVLAGSRKIRFAVVVTENASEPTIKQVLFASAAHEI